MKKLFKLFLSLIVCALTITLSSCSNYVSSYKAIGLVRMNTLSKVETSFYSLEGTLVFKVKILVKIVNVILTILFKLIKVKLVFIMIILGLKKN